MDKFIVWENMNLILHVNKLFIASFINLNLNKIIIYNKSLFMNNDFL